MKVKKDKNTNVAEKTKTQMKAGEKKAKLLMKAEKR